MGEPCSLLRALESGAAWSRRLDRVRLVFTGPDRAKTLHNLTTNDIKRLAPGHGCEAFVTSPQGRTLAIATVLATSEAIWLLSDEASRAAVEPHLRKYTALDDVLVEDSSARTFKLHLAGPGASLLVPGVGEDDLANAELAVGPARVLAVRESPLGLPGLSLMGDLADEAGVLAELERRAAAGAVPLAELGPSGFEALRVAAGTPASGRDVTEKNLPQEVGRDARAIHFTKGCYLGQETVARLDALGHVNRLLRGLVLEGDAALAPGTPLRAGEREAGFITTSAVSIRTGRPLALGYVKTAYLEPGTGLKAAPEGSAEVGAVVSGLPIEGF
jgi:folate-binding protein YgfZ